jgi:hypothetical protein
VVSELVDGFGRKATDGSGDWMYPPRLTFIPSPVIFLAGKQSVAHCGSILMEGLCS